LATMADEQVWIRVRLEGYIQEDEVVWSNFARLTDIEKSIPPASKSTPTSQREISVPFSSR